METFIAWSGFLGAWLLVAGPLYQGVLELREEDADQAGADPGSPVAPPPPPSPWWWFLPPVMLVLRRRRSIAYHRTVLAVLSPQQREHRERFIRKATGWFVVAIGGTFIAVKETWELVEHHEWHPAVFVLVLVVMLALVGGNTVWQASRWSRGSDPDRGERRTR
ncbi:hypothetical protein QUG92_07590 [Curtobacterium sp. RHCKG23]|uniref:Uncharacterized protein n=1 Tax=Curtobacterium citri TaxID=3055139 RepID=A0ABT7T5V6_9MICO|nr:hypothetical protein [Curtobacterium citri]MDM7884966.1 hypothetical protein [Curtobacterium citri]